jgi:hypothetical protein
MPEFDPLPLDAELVAMTPRLDALLPAWRAAYVAYALTDEAGDKDAAEAAWRRFDAVDCELADLADRASTIEPATDLGWIVRFRLAAWMIESLTGATARPAFLRRFIGDLLADGALLGGLRPGAAYASSSTSQ